MWFWRFVHWLAIDCRIWVAWSRVYRWLWRRKHRRSLFGLPVLTVDEAQDAMDRIAWAADSWRALWDAVGSPERFQRLIIRAVVTGHTASRPFRPEHDCDCDDFACWAATVVPGSRILQVAWLDGWRFRGHVVAVRDEPDGTLVHFGNWGTFRGFQRLRDVVSHVLADKPLIGWALLMPELRLVRASRGMPG